MCYPEVREKRLFHLFIKYEILIGFNLLVEEERAEQTVGGRATKLLHGWMLMKVSGVLSYIKLSQALRQSVDWEWRHTEKPPACHSAVKWTLSDNGSGHLTLVKGVASVIKSALAGVPVEPARLECCVIPANTDCSLTCRRYFCERKPAFIEVGQCVSRRREGNNEKWVTSSTPGNGCSHDGDQVLGGGLVPC